MRRNPYGYYLLVQVLTIPLVMLIFKLIADRKIASLVASFVFISVSLGIMAAEFRNFRFERKIFWLAGLQFFLLFVVPIFLLRVINWSEDFSSLHWGPISGPWLHRFSNFSDLLWMVVNLMEWWRFKIRKAL